MDAYYSISRDDGLTWTSPIKVPRSVGHSAYRDQISGSFRTRTTAMGGSSGFIFSYVRDSENGVPKTYVRVLTTSNQGLTYDLGREKKIGTSITNDTDAVVGLRFFRPSGAALMDIHNPGKISIAIQIREGNSSTSNDILPVRIGQEYLSQSAYPLDEQIEQYDTDIADENTLLVNVNILGSPATNIDYFAEGLTGAYTNKYRSAFDRVGTNSIFYRYEPLIDSEMNDESGYDYPTRINAKVVYEVSSYGFPLGHNAGESYQAYIERDIRQIHLPPDFHIGRTYLVNQGNYFKRTVWTLAFDGNDYEVSQIVPVFIENQIVYYTANLYVIGPSNNPFSKRTLPSET